MCGTSVSSAPRKFESESRTAGWESSPAAAGAPTGQQTAAEAHNVSFLQGIMALDSPYTGIVDWRLVALRYGQDFEEAGGTVVTESEVNDISMVKESPAGSAEGKTQLLH